MVVYWEYAFIENFLLDGLLLFLALKCARGRVKFFNLLFASVLGAGEALLFPLISVSVPLVWTVKILGGILICIVAVSRGTKKTYLVAIFSFFALTFALGGLLTAIYSFAGVPYEANTGYLVESAPIALVLAVAGIFGVIAFYALRAYFRFRDVKRRTVDCALFEQGRRIHIKAFYDSGNLLVFRGEPVNVLSPLAALALFGKGAKSVGRMRLKTVSGEIEVPVLRCEKMKIDRAIKHNIYLAAADVGSEEFQLLLHTSFMGERNGSIRRSESVPAKDKGK